MLKFSHLILSYEIRTASFRLFRDCRFDADRGEWTVTPGSRERESRDERMERVWNYFLMTTRAESGIAAAGSGGVARKRRSICRRTNDPYGVAPTDCRLDAMAPARWFSLNYKLNYSPGRLKMATVMRHKRGNRLGEWYWGRRKGERGWEGGGAGKGLSSLGDGIDTHRPRGGGWGRQAAWGRPTLIPCIRN